MLTEEDKTRIRLEEIYRQELRTRLTEKRTRPEKILFFLNSAFFLWFLSTAVIGTVSFLYAKWDSRKEDERRRYEQKRLVDRESAMVSGKLDTEIASRLRFVNGLIDTEKSFPQEITLIRSVLILEKPSAMDYPVNVFPEYSNRSFQSLLWELAQVVPEGEKKEIVAATEEAKKLTALFITRTGGVNSPPVPMPTGKRKRKDALEVLVENKEELTRDLSRLDGIISLKAFNLRRWGRPLSSIADK